nr:hypothetical protein [uncultured Campylobacter sp.]
MPCCEALNLGTEDKVFLELLLNFKKLHHFATKINLISTDIKARIPA